MRIVCNSGLDEADIATARAAERTMRTEWCDGKPETMTEAQRPRYERLRALLRAGRVEVRVLPNAAFGLIHGKAGVITYADGRRTSFLGSINETAEAWTQHYELVWEDDAPDAVAGKFPVVLRHGEQRLGKGRRLCPRRLPQALILVRVHDNDDRFPMLGHRLRPTPGSLDQGAEAVLGLLHRPQHPAHGMAFLDTKSV